MKILLSFLIAIGFINISKNFSNVILNSSIDAAGSDGAPEATDGPVGSCSGTGHCR